MDWDFSFVKRIGEIEKGSLSMIPALKNGYSLRTS